MKKIVGFLALVLIATTGVAENTSAQSLGWNLEQGERFEAINSQSNTMHTRVNKRDSNVASTVTLVMDWLVDDASDGNATITQTIKSIEVSIDNPADPTKSVAINTASDKKPAKNSRDLLMQLQTLIGIQFEVKMDSQGEILSVDLPEDSLEKLAEIPKDSWLKALLDPGKLQGQIGQSMIKLPAGELTKGKSWKLTPARNPNTFAAVNPGSRQITYLGTETIKGGELEVFKLSTLEKFNAMQTATEDNAKNTQALQVATFEWTGQMNFDREGGYCPTCDNQTTIKTKQEHRDMKIETTVVVDSKFQLKKKE